jgi:hypothetical protein
VSQPSTPDVAGSPASPCWIIRPRDSARLSLPPVVGMRLRTYRGDGVVTKIFGDSFRFKPDHEDEEYYFMPWQHAWAEMLPPNGPVGPQP